jgi:transcriptional regulator with XRE-family HTH domain
MMWVVTFRSGKCLLRQRLREAGITQAQLSEKIKMPIAQVNDYYHHRKKPSLDTARNISHAIGCSIEDLFEWVEVSRRRGEQE